MSSTDWRWAWWWWVGAGIVAADYRRRSVFHNRSAVGGCTIEVQGGCFCCTRWHKDALRDPSGWWCTGHQTQSMMWFVVLTLPWEQTFALKTGLNYLEHWLPDGMEVAKGLNADGIPLVCASLLASCDLTHHPLINSLWVNSLHWSCVAHREQPAAQSTVKVLTCTAPLSQLSSGVLFHPMDIDKIRRCEDNNYQCHQDLWHSLCCVPSLSFLYVAIQPRHI